jgi:competence ComEA-like helix-hairpin-helix protein
VPASPPVNPPSPRDHNRALALLAAVMLAIGVGSAVLSRCPPPPEKPWIHQPGTPVELTGDGVHFLASPPTLRTLLMQAHHPCNAGEINVASPHFRPEIREDDTDLLAAGDRVTVGERCLVRVDRMAGAARLTLGLRLDPDRERAEDLAALPGVGPALARAIVQDRARRGPFRSLDALLRVRGIGPATLRRVQRHVTLRP